MLHLIGETLPAGLLLAAVCALSEYLSTGSTLSLWIDPARSCLHRRGREHSSITRVRCASIHRAVQAPGSALPSWQILCRIAQKLGVPGFEYENEAQIRAELESMNVAAAEPDASILNLFQPDSAAFPSSRSDDHAYMGFPLRTWVAGFQVLYPEPAEE